MTSETRQQVQSRARTELLQFLEDFMVHIANTRATDTASRQLRRDLRTDLERRAVPISNWLVLVIGDDTVTPAGGQPISRTALIPTALLLDRPYFSFGNDSIDNYARMVESQINLAVGTIDADMWPTRSSEPELTITDPVLAERCLPLLRQPTPADTIIRDATVILEDRIRTKAGHDALTRALPDSRQQSGEKLVNALFSANSPVISVSPDKGKRIAFFKMLVGIFAYPRNESHHHISNELARSWCWSVVGIVDQLLAEITEADLIHQSTNE